MNDEVSRQDLPQVGMVIDGYRILALLGKGGMGAVYKVENRGALYALKVVLDPTLSEVQRFEHEAVSLAAAKHKNIVDIHTVRLNPPWPYILFEFIEGQDLSSKIMPGEPWPLEKSLSVLRPLAEALDFIHAKGIVHRDLKPANILIRHSDGQPVLTDFGIAKNQSLETLTQQGEIVGTIQYMAPEQFAGERVSPQSDLWALAVILFQLSSGGELPFVGAGMVEIAQNIMTRPPRPLGDFIAEENEELCALLSRALAKDPKQRYESGRAFIEECERALRGEAVVPKKRRGLLPSVLLLVFLISGLLLGLCFAQKRAWERSKKDELKSFAVKLQKLKKGRQNDYLFHALSEEKERPCCRAFSSLKKEFNDFESALSQEGAPYFWNDPRSLQASLKKLQADFVSLAVIHTPEKATQVPVDLPQAEMKMLQAWVNVNKRKYSDAAEIYKVQASKAGPWESVATVMQALCAARLGHWAEAEEAFKGLDYFLAGKPHMAKFRRDVLLHWCAELFLQSKGSSGELRRIFESVQKSTEHRAAFFKDWNQLLQRLFRAWKAEDPQKLELLYQKHRSLSYEFPLIDRLELSRRQLLTCLQSAQKRRDKDFALLYGARLKRLDAQFPIPENLKYGLESNGRLNYIELCVDAHHHFSKGERERLKQLRFIVEAARQGYHLEGFDGSQRRQAMAEERLILSFIEQDAFDPALRFWRAYILRKGRSASQYRDYDYVIRHNKAPQSYKAIALTESARLLLEDPKLKPKMSTKDRFQQALSHLEKALLLPHPRPNVIHSLRFNAFYYYHSEILGGLRQFNEQIWQCLQSEGQILKQRLALTREKALWRGRPYGQPFSRIALDVYHRRQGFCDWNKGKLFYQLKDYKRAIPHFSSAFRVHCEVLLINRLSECIVRCREITDFEPLLKTLRAYEGSKDLKGNLRSKVVAFRKKLLRIQENRRK